MKNIPKKIFLQVEGAYDQDDFNECHEVTWCKDKINKNDIEYVRWTPIDPDDLPEGEVIARDENWNVLKGCLQKGITYKANIENNSGTIVMFDVTHYQIIPS